MKPKGVVITGATGLVGRAVVAKLFKENIPVTVISRDAQHAKTQFKNKVRAFSWDYTTENFPTEAFKGCDTVLHLMGAPLDSAFFAKRKRTVVHESRIQSAKKIIKALPPTITTYASAAAVGIFKPDTNKLYDESWKNTRPKGFLEKLCAEWERTSESAKTRKRRVVYFRFGLILSCKGGFLPKYLRPTKFGIFPSISNGSAALNWIHRDDAVNVIYTGLTTKKMSGPINTVAPEQLTYKDFNRALKQYKKFRLPIRTPAFAIKLLLKDLASVFLTGYTVVPKKLKDINFKWKYPTVKVALKSLLSSRAGK